jgi:5'-nucleotidase
LIINPWRKHYEKVYNINIFITLNDVLFSQTKFSHILITNDDGIEDSKRLIALAKHVSKVADRVTIIVSEFDRSGTSNYLTYGKYNTTLELTCQYNNDEDNVEVYTTPSNPADCVMLGLGGINSDIKPDLVLSGINGGPNIGPNWFGSGTIGAARTAAFFGVKAIALSGFEDDYKESFTILPDWIAAFISSGILDDLEKGDYLTVGFPKIAFNKIKGTKLVEPRVMFDYPEIFVMKKIYGEEIADVDNKTIWVPEVIGNPNNADDKLNDYYLNDGFIVITPMSTNENYPKTFKKFEEKISLLPNIDVIAD